MAIQHELEQELKRLQVKWGRGKELKVVWQSCQKKSQLPYGRQAELRGEVDKVNRILYVYDNELADCIHVVRHEFFEYVIDCELIAPYVTLYNQMQRAYEKSFMESTYPRKESLIEILVEMEENALENGRNEKRNRKHP